MDLFGLKFSLALGAWRLRFVLMVEDADAPAHRAAPPQAAHRIAVLHDASRAGLN